MKNEVEDPRRGPNFGLGRTFLVCLLLSLPLKSSLAVSSKITHHRSSADLLKGQVKDVVIGSKGTLQLGRAWETPVEAFEDVWSINSIVVSGGTVFIGTSPNGGIFKYSLGELTKIYPPESDEPVSSDADPEQGDDAPEPNDSNAVEAEEHLTNEHIFAMATDVAGRLLAGISGKQCKLLRFEAGKTEAIFEPNDAKYIFAIATDDKGNIYLGTGNDGQSIQHQAGIGLWRAPNGHGANREYRDLPAARQAHLHQ